MSTLSVDTIQGQTTAANVKMPAGYVVQMQFTTITSSISTTSTSLVASGLIVAIAPKFSTSKILINLTGGNLNWSSGENSQFVHIYRQLSGGSYSDIGKVAEIHQDSSYGLQHSSELIDSPNTTSTINYQPYYKTSAQTTYFSHSSTNLTLRVMEIAQ